MDDAGLLSAISRLCPAAAPLTAKTDRVAITVPAADLTAVMSTLRDAPELAFDLLMDHTAVDWPGAAPAAGGSTAAGEIELVWQLLSTRHGHTLSVSSRIPRDRPAAPSLAGVWRIAEWQEREVYDLFGVIYERHPDLRRLFLDDTWQGFPLRKDYQDDFMLDKP